MLFINIAQMVNPRMAAIVVRCCLVIVNKIW